MTSQPEATNRGDMEEGTGGYEETEGLGDGKEHEGDSSGLS